MPMTCAVFSCSSCASAPDSVDIAFYRLLLSWPEILKLWLAKLKLYWLTGAWKVNEHAIVCRLTFSTFLHMLLAPTSNSSSPKFAVLLIPSVVSRDLELERNRWDATCTCTSTTTCWLVRQQFLHLICSDRKECNNTYYGAVVLSWNVTVARKTIEGILGWLDIPGNSSDYQIITTTFSTSSDPIKNKRISKNPRRLLLLKHTINDSQSALLSASTATTKYFAKRKFLLLFMHKRQSNSGRLATPDGVPPPWRHGFQAYAWCKRNSPIDTNKESRADYPNWVVRIA